MRRTMPSASIRRSCVPAGKSEGIGATHTAVAARFSFGLGTKAILCSAMGRLYAFAADIDHRLAQTFRKPGLPICPCIVVRQISDEETTTAYLILDDRIDMSSLLRHGAKVKAGIRDCRSQACFINRIQIRVLKLPSKTNSASYITHAHRPPPAAICVVGR
jgi:hypothetical protein